MTTRASVKTPVDNQPLGTESSCIQGIGKRWTQMCKVLSYPAAINLDYRYRHATVSKIFYAKQIQNPPKLKPFRGRSNVTCPSKTVFYVREKPVALNEIWRKRNVRNSTHDFFENEKHRTPTYPQKHDSGEFQKVVRHGWTNSGNNRVDTWQDLRTCYSESQNALYTMYPIERDATASRSTGWIVQNQCAQSCSYIYEIATTKSLLSQ